MLQGLLESTMTKNAIQEKFFSKITNILFGDKHHK